MNIDFNSQSTNLNITTILNTNNYLYIKEKYLIS